MSMIGCRMMSDKLAKRPLKTLLVWSSILVAGCLASTAWWISVKQDRKAEAAWERLTALGAVGVWDKSMVVVSLAGTEVTDDDLAVFRDFPSVQTLDLSRTKICGSGLTHLSEATLLEELIVVDTKLDPEPLAAFRRQHPNATIVTESPPKGKINPFTGQPL